MKKVCWILLWIFCLSIWKQSDIFGEEDLIPHVIERIPPSGIVINESGTYVFEKNLAWNPISDGAAITIQANDVILDLQGHTLKSSITSFKTIGILAIESENLKIVNGKIQNMGLSGIQCNLCIGPSIRKIVVDGLNLNDTAEFIVPTGILTTACINVTIDRCTVKNIHVKTASSAGIQLTGTLTSKVTNCKVKNLLNKDGACSGIGHLLCVDALVKSCKLNKIQTQFIDNLNTEGHTAIGLIPFLSTNITIQECSISNVVGCCDDAHGMSVFICSNAIVEKCKVSNVLDGAGPAHKGAKATGIEIYANDVSISDCFVENIFAINPEDKQATGFSCAQSTGVTFLRCTAENVQVFNEHLEQSPSLGFGTGFGWAPDPRPSLLLPAINVLYQDCTAKHCQVGFDSWFHIDSVWDHITSIDNKIAVLNQGDDAQRTLSCDPCSECGCHQIGCFPTPYTVTVSNVARNNIFLHVTKK